MQAQSAKLSQHVGMALPVDKEAHYQFTIGRFFLSLNIYLGGNNRETWSRFAQCSRHYAAALCMQRRPLVAFITIACLNHHEYDFPATTMCAFRKHWQSSTTVSCDKGIFVSMPLWSSNSIVLIGITINSISIVDTKSYSTIHASAS